MYIVSWWGPYCSLHHGHVTLFQKPSKDFLPWHLEKNQFSLPGPTWPNPVYLLASPRTPLPLNSLNHSYPSPLSVPTTHQTDCCFRQFAPAVASTWKVLPQIRACLVPPGHSDLTFLPSSPQLTNFLKHCLSQDPPYPALFWRWFSHDLKLFSLYVHVLAYLIPHD